MSISAVKRRLIVPEVVQTSKMDCGPACLKSLLAGFDINVSYGRLREACQTDVDGTSIDILEEIAIQLGLEAQQTILPIDHVLLPEMNALPALIVTRLPSGYTHFVVAWRCHANRLVQVMDPASGRRWLTPQQFLDELYIHKYPVPAVAWREWASQDEFIDPLRKNLANLKVKARSVTELIESALADPNWRSLAALDAATRMISAMVRSGGIKRGKQAAHLLRHFFKIARITPTDDTEPIPATYWFAYPTPPDFDEEEHLFLQGAVLVRVLGRVSDGSRSPIDDIADSASGATLSPELVAALEEKPVHPGAELLRLLRADGLLAPTALILGLALAATGIVIEALLFRGLLDLGGQLATAEQRVTAIALLVMFVVVNLLLRLYIDIDVKRFGRRLEARLRIAFLEKIPRLSDRYFRSRPISDMVERSHSIHKLRTLPDLGKQFIQSLFDMLLTTAGIIWLHPPLAPITVLAGAFSVFVPLTAHSSLTELDLRSRTHLGGLGHYYLDTMLGLIAVRTHRAENAIRRQHESLLAEWVRTKIKFLRLFITMEGLQMMIALACVIWIVLDYIAQEGPASSVLLLAYWGLSLMFRGQQVISSAREYARQRNITLRLLEPLGAPEEKSLSKSKLCDSAPSGGLTILMEGVTVRAAGHTILQNIDLKIEAGTHVAIVGSSGAGKSSLIGLLLGWHRSATGQISVDDDPLDSQRLLQLRRETAWVDPAIQIWNRSFLDNLLYGTSKDSSLPFSQVIQQADLRQVLERLPEGLQTALGEGGGLVSGGEGQRVRLGRAMLREGVRLVILDEPFRGLGRSQRSELLARTRQLWSDVTLLCITHDVSETQGFERVLVIEEGQIAEDGNPAKLAAQNDSRYRAMLDADKQIHTQQWGHQEWRQWWMQDGRVKE